MGAVKTKSEAKGRLLVELGKGRDAIELTVQVA
jgi:hypothetical protein